MKTLINFLLCFLNIKKEEKMWNLNSWIKNQKLPSVVLENLQSKGSARITIRGLVYFFISPFVKYTPRPMRDEKTFFKYLKNQGNTGSKKEFFSRITNWLENDMKLPDINDMELDHGISFLDGSAFYVEYPGAPLIIAVKRNAVNFQLIIVIELYVDSFKKKRSLIEIVTLVKTLAEHERKNFAGYALINAFNMLEDPETIIKEFDKGKDSAYCFLLKK